MNYVHVNLSVKHPFWTLWWIVSQVACSLCSVHTTGISIRSKLVK